MKVILLTCAFIAGSVASASEPAQTDVVAKILQQVIVQKLPSPAVSTKHNWDHQKEFVVGYDVKRRGVFNWVATPRTEKKNEGHWSHLTIGVNEPATKLHLELTNLKSMENGPLTFQAALRAESVSLNVKQQIWARGVRVLSDETRATCKAAVHIDCELSQRLELKPGATLPEIVFKLKVTKAELFYTDLRVQHTLGVGGDAAKIIGETTHKMLNKMKPSVERDLIAKANAAIVKSASDKEVRLGLASLMKK